MDILISNPFIFSVLTDLKCRVDRDCVHVNRSSCHPGAGYCSCPGNTIYVPEKHACSKYDKRKLNSMKLYSSMS